MEDSKLSGKTTISVTKEIAYVGMRVTRGKYWCFGNQDGGSGGVGTITSVGPGISCDTEVKWDKVDERNSYRIGGPCYDLYVYNDDTESSAASTNKFSIGDTVKVIGKAHFHNLAMGDIGKIVEITTDQAKYRVERNRDGYIQYLYEVDLELATQDTSSDIKVGDTVYCVDDKEGMGIKRGHTYTVEDKSGEWITVKGISYYYSKDRFSKNPAMAGYSEASINQTNIKNTENGKNSTVSTSNRGIKVQKSSPLIKRQERRTGSGICGRRCKATIGRGPTRNKKAVSSR